jgi:4-diphosphocytidyl-2-C-methyl-D-erythritol kinase
VKITVKAYAKLNLFLDILGKRPDGYHEVLTAMCAVDLADDVTVSVSDGDGVTLTCDVQGIPSDERNSAHRAALLFLAELGVKRHADINIVKHIPVMAGLGGSGADAAAVLKALNRLLGEPFTLEELMRNGAKIGTDVPFCIHGGAALCTGTGAMITQALPLPDCVFVVIKPDFECCTKSAYTLYAINPVPPAEFLYHYNIFEKLHNNPKIDRIKADLISAGASAACLTGSGSAVYGVFADMKEARKAYGGLDYNEKYIVKPTT